MDTKWLTTNVCRFCNLPRQSRVRLQNRRLRNMKITLYAFGSRGDVQPCVALALGLQQAGHLVTLAAGNNFEAWVRGYGLQFAPIGVDIQAMMQSPQGIAWSESRPHEQPTHMRRLFAPMAARISDAVWTHSEGADLLISSFTCDGLAMTAARKRNIRWATLALQPVRPTRSGAANFFPIRPRNNSITNYWFGKLSERILWRVFGDFHNTFRKRMGEPPQKPADFYAECGRGLALHAFSPSVVPPPADWPAHWPIVGYWHLDEPDWTPPTELARFIDAAPPPVYIGFGSATDSNAEATTRMIFDAVRDADCRAVVYGGWAGIGADLHSQNVHVLRQGVPHSWLFPRMAGVVHHGGAGTSASGFRAGVPQFVVPHFAEQPYWGRRTHELGVGVKPVGKTKLTRSALTAGLQQMLRDGAMHASARALGNKVRAEDGVAAAVKWLSS